MEASPNTNLIELIDDTLAALPDEVARRRWGRGLSYFRDRATREGSRRSVLVDDIVNFLDDKHGLKQASSALPADLIQAVHRLNEECTRILRDEPVVAFTFGIVDGGHAPQGPQVRAFANELRKIDLTGADLSINVIFQLGGAISKPDWTGVHGGRLHPAKRGMVINAAPPEALLGDELDRFLVNALQEAVERTERSLKRHKLGWSTQPHRDLLATLGQPRIHREADGPGP